jgi:DNA-directed RNA polymerase subunit RPC12/RpoP
MLNKSAEISDSDSTNQTGLPSAALTVQEQVSEESSGSTGAGPSTTTSSVTTASTSSPVCTIAATATGNRVTKDEKNHLCPYCQKSFPESIILHHKKLHYKKPFYSCITCGKNFRTELGLESHRCTSTAD